MLTGLTGQATKQGHKTPMAIGDILRLQATTFAMAMRKNVNGPGGGKNEAYSRCRYLVSLVMGFVGWVYPFDGAVSNKP